MPHPPEKQDDPRLVDHPDGVEVEGMFFPIDFDTLHARGEADEAAGRIYDHEEVMQWVSEYATQLAQRQGHRGHG